MPLILLYGVPINYAKTQELTQVDFYEMHRLAQRFDEFHAFWLDSESDHQTPPDFLGYKYYYQLGSNGLYKLDFQEHQNEFLDRVAAVFGETPSWYVIHCDDYHC